ncbi:cupin domain-containing protein [Roseibium sp.]|uniref:cupin domain-containing protein n=1 Tax=Roseibium sp. TaxID=1936156 RepID=UPI003A9866A8
MKLHADLTKRASVDSGSLAWIASPSGGVERRMLERDGEEVARATTIVRFAPGSDFPAHAHEMGEEFLVLDGVFSDETGDFPKGMYVRNPPGSMHIPSTTQGATILVKLRQISLDDDHVVRIDTTDTRAWQETRPDEATLPLFTAANETVEMVEWAEGMSIGPLRMSGGVEYFVLSGSFADEDGIYTPGCWLRLPPGSTQKLTSKTGARVWRKSGHLTLSLAT